MSLPDPVRAALLLVAVAGLLWNVANVIAAWRYERRRGLRLAKPRRPALVIHFTRKQPTNHFSKVHHG